MFEQLDEIIKRHFHDGAKLNEAKELFAMRIDSRRALEATSDVNQFLGLLKRRGLYNADEFYAVRLFMKLIDEPEFNRLAEEHERVLQTRPPAELSNIYAARRRRCNGAANGLSSHTEAHSLLYSSPFPARNPIPAEKRNEIFQIISNAIEPKDFHTLSRFLMFCDDNEIEDIELNHRDFRTRTMVVLERYELRKNSLPKLLGALELMKRRDIVDQIKTL